MTTPEEFVLHVNSLVQDRSLASLDDVLPLMRLPSSAGGMPRSDCYREYERRVTEGSFDSNKTTDCAVELVKSIASYESRIEMQTGDSETVVLTERDVVLVALLVETERQRRLIASLRDLLSTD